MQIIFAPRGILQIDDAKITYRNFSGEGSKFNREGDRNFALIIPDREMTKEEADSFLDIHRSAKVEEVDGEPTIIYDDLEIVTIADALKAVGWSLKERPSNFDEESLFITMGVKVKFNDRGPNVFLETGRKHVQLSEDTIGMIDDIDILSIDMDIRPYTWEVGGKTGRSAYLQTMHVIQEVDRITARFASEESPEE